MRKLIKEILMRNFQGNKPKSKTNKINVGKMQLWGEND